jgi:hypothetical protein
MSAAHNYHPNNIVLPEVGQMDDYIEVMREILHELGRGARTIVQYDEAGGRIIPRFAGKEFLLPGAHTEWCEDRDSKTVEVERERRFSALYRPLGLSPAKLAVLESDSKRIKQPSGDIYHTLRTMYRFEWSAIVGVFVAQQRRFEIISNTDIDAEVLPRLEFDAPDRLIFEHARNHEEFKVDDGWQPMSETDMDLLLHRTDEYGKSIVAHCLSE